MDSPAIPPVPESGASATPCTTTHPDCCAVCGTDLGCVWGHPSDKAKALSARIATLAGPSAIEEPQIQTVATEGEEPRTCSDTPAPVDAQGEDTGASTAAVPDECAAEPSSPTEPRCAACDTDRTRTSTERACEVCGGDLAVCQECWQTVVNSKDCCGDAGDAGVGAGEPSLAVTDVCTSEAETEDDPCVFMDEQQPPQGSARACIMPIGFMCWSSSVDAEDLLTQCCAWDSARRLVSFTGLLWRDMSEDSATAKFLRVLLASLVEHMAEVSGLAISRSVAFGDADTLSDGELATHGVTRGDNHLCYCKVTTSVKVPRDLPLEDAVRLTRLAALSAVGLVSGFEKYTPRSTPTSPSSGTV
jgi:hypothetical protein